MRAMIVMTALLLAACGQSQERRDANAAAVDYRPPTVTSRADFGGAIERRFHRLDRNGDDKLSPEELPRRLRPGFAAADTNHDGVLSSDEWGAMMLARFDTQDINRDGSVTSEERKMWRARQGAGGDAPAQ